VLEDDRGIAFGAARQKNGRDFPLFYKGFVAPVDGAYNVGFDGNHLTDRPDHTAVTILSGQVFQTVARGLPVRYHGVVSVSGKEPKRYSKTVHLTAGEYLAVHAYSSKTINRKPKKLGVVINKMQVESPVLNSWPPPAYRKLMPDVKFTTAEAPESAMELNHKTLQLPTPTKQLLTKALRFVEQRTTGNQKADLKTAVSTFQRDGDLFGALRLGLLGLFTSEDFLVVSNQLNDVEEQRKFLARSIWRSVPDEELLSIDELSDRTLDQQLEHMVENDMRANHFIDSDFTFLNQRIALHYGMSDVHGHHFRKVSLPDDSLRGGLMTMGSLLKVTSSGQQTSPIVRGAWISQKIVGNPLSPPPTDVEAIDPDLSDAKSIREEIAAHKAKESCYACHKSIDPYGLALEVFGSAGRERKHYRVPRIRNPKGFAYLWSANGFYKKTIPVNASGEIFEGEFDDIRGLKTLLQEKSHSIVYHFSKTFYEYANGASPSLNTRMKLWALGDSGVRTAIKEVLKLSIKERTK